MQCNCCACGVWPLLESKHFKAKVCLGRKFEEQFSEYFSTFQIRNQWELSTEIQYGPKKIWCLHWNFNDMEAHKFKHFNNLQWIWLWSPNMRTLRPVCFHKYIQKMSSETAHTYCISEILNSPWSTIPSFLYSNGLIIKRREIVYLFNDPCKFHKQYSEKRQVLRIDACIDGLSEHSCTWALPL